MNGAVSLQAVSIRFRLALWYGALCALALVTVSLLSYSVYARSQYLILDRILILSTNHAAAGVIAAGRSYVLNAERDSLEVLLRLYAPDGTLRQTSPGGPDIPPTSPTAPLRAPAGPAYDWLARLAPMSAPDIKPRANAAFGIVRFDGQRWRRYVVRLDRGGLPVAYVEALTPLGRLDNAVAHLRNLLFGLGLASVAVVVGLGWALAGSALAPISRLTRTARDIAASRDTRRRVPTRGGRDELGRLATTFNEMLESLDAAAQSQQRFIADASHELRAPLAVMQGNLELLRRFPVMPASERAEVLVEAEREAARLSRLVNDLLLLARSDAGVPLRKRRVALHDLALEAFRDGTRLARGQVLQHQPGQALYVTGDPDRLKQLVLIVLENALKFTPEGKCVTLDVRARSDQAVIEVHDEGVGIPEGDLPNIFQRFYRADPARSGDPGGTGLGLSIAQWIVRQHGGTIEVKSALGRGTTVTVELPLAPGNPDGATEEPFGREEVRPLPS